MTELETALFPDLFPDLRDAQYGADLVASSGEIGITSRAMIVCSPDNELIHVRVGDTWWAAIACPRARMQAFARTLTFRLLGTGVPRLFRSMGLGRPNLDTVGWKDRPTHTCPPPASTSC